MGLITDKLSIGNALLSSYNLDVSGNVRIDALSGTGTRMVVPDANGLLSTAPYSSTLDSTGLVGIFGDGSDGDVTLSSSTTLTREMNYRNLTLNGSVILNTAGYIVRVSGTLIMSASSIISCDGSAGQNAPAAGTKGNGGGSTMTAARYPWQCVPGSGGAGEQRSAAANSNGTGASRGSSTTTATSSGPVFIRAGAGGGGGGAHGSTTGRVAPVAGTAVWHGNAGGVGATASGTSTTAYASGGGGGGGGGICVVFANDVSAGTSTYIRANGGNGGNGYVGSNATGGGGGGGGGGTAILVYKTYKALPSLSANGGSVGTGGSGGTSGSNGLTILYRIKE